MTKTVTTNPDGVRFEWDPETGESGLYYPNGQYFRGEDDYDHGWVYRHKGMMYSQKRRTKLSVFLNRASVVLMAVALVGVAFCWSMVVGIATDNVWIAIPFYLFFQSVLAIIFIKRFIQDEVFDFVWYGRFRETH